MSDIAIRVENLSKRYRIGLKEEMHETLFEAVTDFVKRPVKNLRRLRRLSTFSTDGLEADDIIWALKDVSFEVKRGEVLGIIGRNGVGKSTLLKILSRITDPTEGRAIIKGRVSSLLEVGTGFHPELTGRENVYLNGTILGMRKTEIDRKFDEIVAFAEVEKYIDTPVKRYSSGMKVRLAFAVAAHLEPEILLVDEVLAVGDVGFQKKCLGKMGDVAKEGRTVLFVSHNMGAASNLCTRGVLLEGGRVAEIGPIEEVVSAYLARVQSQGSVDLEERTDREGNGRIRATGFWIENDAGEHGSIVRTGDAVTFVVEYACHGSEVLPVGVEFAFYIADVFGRRLFALSNMYAGYEFQPQCSGGKWACRIAVLPLMPGHYTVDLGSAIRGELCDRIPRVADFQVVEGDFFGSGKLPKSQLKHGFLLVPQEWRVP